MAMRGASRCDADPLQTNLTGKGESIMTQWIARTFALTAMALFGVACIASPGDSDPAGDAELAFDPAEEAVGEASLAVEPGCFADSTTCPAGNKTCGAWSAWSACAGDVCNQYGDCYEGEIICGRGGCGHDMGTATPQNRARNCTMNVSGIACVQYDYREKFTGCGC